MQNSPTQEHAAALIEVAKIANHRFDDLVADANPLLLTRAYALEEVDSLTAPAPTRTAGNGATQTEGLRRFNAMPDQQARSTLASCLDVPRWIDEVNGGRPYETTRSVLHKARAAAASFTDAELDAALGRHPRIGEKAGAGHDVEFSEREQSAIGDTDPAITRAIHDGNIDYENKFDRVFLIRAAGRPAEEILAELRRRLTNTPDAERAEVITQLREIALTRLERILA
jgi:2-oxo-4-hydroxy-4-carboxy-5-ureidoimidazoline decarboxylase